MRRAWVIVAVLAGALCVPGTAFAVDHVSLFVSPSAVAGHPGWRLSASVPAREATGGEIVGVSLRRGAESHDLRGVARRTRTVAFDGRRGKLEVSPDQAGGRGPDALEEVGYRRRGGLETNAAGRPSRERRVERGWRTAVHVTHRRRARDFPPVGKDDAQCVSDLTRRLPRRTPVQEAALEPALVSGVALEVISRRRQDRADRLLAGSLPAP